MINIFIRITSMLLMIIIVYALSSLICFSFQYEDKKFCFTSCFLIFILYRITCIEIFINKSLDQSIEIMEGIKNK